MLLDDLGEGGLICNLNVLELFSMEMLLVGDETFEIGDLELHGLYLGA